MSVKDFITIIKQSEPVYPQKVFGQKRHVYTCLNSAGYMYARKKPELYSNMDGIFVDGILMCKALKWLWRVRITRRSFDMTSMAKDLFRRLDDASCPETIYFIGSKQNQVEASVAEFKRHYPRMQVVGFRNGYFCNGMERNRALQDIINQSPDYVIVGMGKPMQDEFALELKCKGYNGCVFTCGGFLHQSCNKLYYYPEWIDKYNLRWLYRFVKEGTWSRLFNDLFTFPLLFTYDRIKALSSDRKPQKTQ